MGPCSTRRTGASSQSPQKPCPFAIRIMLTLSYLAGHALQVLFRQACHVDVRAEVPAEICRTPFDLLLNSVSLTSGTVVAGTDDRAHPVSFSFTGSITTGEVLEMDVLQSCQSCSGAIAGLTLDIASTTV